jgi:hypothetical protein
VNGFLYLSSVYGMRGRPWGWTPTIGWAFGLALHGVSVFVIGEGSALRDRMMQRERERLEREQGRR